MLLEYWGHLLKVFWIKLPICIVFVETKNKVPNFHVELIEFDNKTILDFRFFPISLLLVQYCFWSTGGCLLKVFIAKLTICIVFVETKKKIPYFHVDLIELDHKTIPDFWFYFNISFIGPKMLLEFWGHLLKVFWAKLPIRIVFVETKKTKPIFHVVLIEFDHETVLHFWYFQYVFYRSKNASWVLGGTYWKYSEQNYQYASFLWKRRK